MSQAGIINVAGGGGGGSPVQTLTGDTGGAVPPTANNIFILGAQSTDNNTVGITFAGNPGISTLLGTLTNRITGTATTTDAATTQTLYSFPLGATPGTYILEVQVIGYNITDELSAGYNSTRVIRTDGATAVLISANPGIIAEETDGATNMDDVLVANGISGNNATLTANGILDKTIHWLALTSYIFVS